MYSFNFKIITQLVGALLLIVGSMMAVSLSWAFYYGEEWQPLAVSAILTTGAGLGIRFIFVKAPKKDLTRSDGYLMVTLGWVFMSLFGTLPYLLSGAIPGFINAFFETMSGISTTGATILTDIEALPKYLLFWRSMTHWIGGMGIIVLTVAILPLLGIGGMQLFVAEAPGVTTDKLHPRITETAKRLWLIYVALTSLETILLKVAGMGWFDAINHAMSTMASGGFSTKNNSVAFFQEPVIHYIIIVFMFLAGVNFTLIYLGLSGKLKAVWRNEEFRVYSINIIILATITSLCLAFMTNIPVEEAFRNGFFQIISLITTTGLITDDYLQWPNFLMFLCFVLFFSGGSTGSTAGGIKMMRTILLIKNSLTELRRQLHPNAILPVRLSGKAVPQKITNTVAAFVLIWLIIFFLGSLILSAMGIDFMTAAGATAACLGNVGPAIGTVGPVSNYAHMPDLSKVFLAFLMLLGRLELFTVLVLFSPYFWTHR